MASETPSGREILRGALGRGKDCPPIEKLEAALDSDRVPVELARHLEDCSHCRAELDLMRSFLREPSPEEMQAVRAVADRLHAPREVYVSASAPFWRKILRMRWLSPAIIAAAAVLIVAAVGLQWRHAGAPRLYAPNQPEADVLRSGSIQVMEPVGDLSAVPGRIQWQPAPGADQYRVRLLEVDRSELWNASTQYSQIDIPTTVQAKIVPAKSILLEVEAFDKSGRKLAQSDAVPFRLLQKVYKR